MLEFEGDWRYDSPGAVEREVVWGCRELIDKISGQGRRQATLEHFKSYFARAVGTTSYVSSDEGWASTDLDSLMEAASVNAPMFIEAFYDACEELGNSSPGMKMPGVGRINRVLTDAGSGFQIDPPRLVATRVHVPIKVPEEAPSLEAQAEKLIHDALNASETALSRGDVPIP